MPELSAVSCGVMRCHIDQQLISNGCTVAFGASCRASWRHGTAVADHPHQ